MRRASCSRASESAARSSSTMASATSGSTAERRRRWPASSARRRIAGATRSAGTGPDRPSPEVAGWLRRAGSALRPGGDHVTWSVAEGRRGRRWREVVVDAGGAVRHSLLLELDPDGRFSHLELSTAAGLLTLHPEGDGTLHGNAVTGDGVRHIAGWAWDAERAIEVEGSVVCEATWRRRDGSPFGSLQLV